MIILLQYNGLLGNMLSYCNAEQAHSVMLHQTMNARNGLKEDYKEPNSWPQIRGMQQH